jgi:hypothetical protein
MAPKKPLKALQSNTVKIFKISNRRGFAAICKANLTEGRTPYQTYQRMQKALKRMGFCLKDITAKQALKLVKKTI